MKKLMNVYELNDNDEIYKYSNPFLVQEKATELLGDYGTIYRSNRKGKKYAIYDPYNNKYIHFGSIHYEDYTKHNNDLRRSYFRNRNRKWSNNPIFSPSFLSYHLLW